MSNETETSHKYCKTEQIRSFWGWVVQTENSNDVRWFFRTRRGFAESVS